MWHRKNHSPDASTSGEAVGRPKRQRREGRGWGPFSGGQLTIMIVTVAVLVLFPVGAWAVSGSNVFVTDATSGTQAKVTGTGRVKVDTGLAPFGVVGTLSFPGSISNVAALSDIFTSGRVVPNGCGGGAGTCFTLAAPPAGKDLVITSIHLDTFNDATPGVSDYFEFYRSSDGTCSTASRDVDFDFVNPAGLGQTVLPYEPGLAVPAGKALCALDGDFPTLSGDVSAWGYTVAAGSVPSAAPTGPKPQLGKQP